MTMRVFRVLLLAVAGSVPLVTGAAQPPQRLPPVHIRSTLAEPWERWPDSLRQVLQDSLARGRTRWERTRPAQYRVATISTWAMMRPPHDPATDGQLEFVRVRGDAIESVGHRVAPAFNPAPAWTQSTIERVFRALEAEVRNPKRRIVTLVLDTVWGFPRSWHTTETSDGPGFRPRSEQELGGAVVFFEPAERCVWWRRVLRRCP